MKMPCGKYIGMELSAATDQTALRHIIKAGKPPAYIRLASHRLGYLDGYAAAMKARMAKGDDPESLSESLGCRGAEVSD